MAVAKELRGNVFGICEQLYGESIIQFKYLNWELSAEVNVFKFLQQQSKQMRD
jgi:hypothetical protein